jgi:ribosome-associated translation inhibitor RaiA
LQDTSTNVWSVTDRADVQETNPLVWRCTVTPLVDRRFQAAPVSAPVRQMAGRDSTIPAHVRVKDVTLTDDDHADIERKLGMRLGKFARPIERVTVRARDVNGPRGGVDQECSVKVVLRGLPSVVVTRRHAALAIAIDTALHAVEHAVRRSVHRRRMKPLHGRTPREVS